MSIKEVPVQGFKVAMIQATERAFEHRRCIQCAKLSLLVNSAASLQCISNVSDNHLPVFEDGVTEQTLIGHHKLQHLILHSMQFATLVLEQGMLSAEVGTAQVTICQCQATSEFDSCNF